MTLDFQGTTKSLVRNNNLGSGMATICRSVGIGVRDPDQALEVAGIIHVSGEQAETPAAPADADGGLFYTKADGKPYWRSNEVAEFALNTDTNTTYTAGNGLTLTSTTFTICDPATLAELTESDDATDDKILLWDESGSTWKYMTLDNLQDSIDTGGGGGSGDITRVNITAGTGLTGTTDTASGDHTQTLALSHLGIQSLSDPDADRIMFWDDSAGATAFLTAGTNLTISGTTISATDTNTTYSAGNGVALSTTTFSVAAGTGLAQESSGLALSHLGIEALSDPDADRIMFWDDDAGAMKFLVPNDNLAISGTNLNATDTNTFRTVTAGGNTLGAGETLAFTAGTGISIAESAGAVTITNSVSDTNTFRTVTAGGNTLGAGETLAFTAGTGVSIAESAGAVTITNTVSDTNTTYSAGNGIALSTTTFSVAGGNGLAQESSGLALDDPANLDELTESNDATDDKIFLWDEDASTWKYMTLDNLQDSIDTGGGGGGVSLSGTTNNTIATVTGSDALIGEANLTFDGNSLLVVTGSASAVPCTIKGAGSQSADLLNITDSSDNSLVKVEDDGAIRLGVSGPRKIWTENESGTNTAGKHLDLRAGKSTGNAIGGSVRIYTAPAGSSGSGVNNHAEALRIYGDKVVDFKIAGGAKTVTLQNDAMDQYMMGTATVTVNATEWLEIKVAGNTRYIPVWS